MLMKVAVEIMAKGSELPKYSHTIPTPNGKLVLCKQFHVCSTKSYIQYLQDKALARNVVRLHFR